MKQMKFQLRCLLKSKTKSLSQRNKCLVFSSVTFSFVIKNLLMVFLLHCDDCSLCLSWDQFHTREREFILLPLHMRVLTVCLCCCVFVCVCESQEEQIILNRKKKFKSSGSRDFNCNFEFGERDVLNDDDDWAMADVIKQLKNKVEPAAEPVEKMNTQLF